MASALRKIPTESTPLHGEELTMDIIKHFINAIEELEGRTDMARIGLKVILQLLKYKNVITSTDATEALKLLEDKTLYTEYAPEVLTTIVPKKPPKSYTRRLQTVTMELLILLA